MTALPRSIEQLKKDAKHLKRTIGVSHAEALKRVAVGQGFPSWESFLAQQAPVSDVPLVYLPVMTDDGDLSARTWPTQPLDIPLFMPILGVSGAGKTVLALKLGQQLCAHEHNVCFVSPAVDSFSRPPLPYDIGGILARGLIRNTALFTAIDRDALLAAGGYQGIFEKVAPNTLVLLDGLVTVGDSRISKKNPIDIGPLLARGCRIIVCLQIVVDIDLLRFGNDPTMALNITRASDCALLGRDSSAFDLSRMDLSFLRAFGFGNGLLSCFRKPPLPSPDSMTDDRLFRLVQHDRTRVARVSIMP